MSTKARMQCNQVMLSQALKHDPEDKSTAAEVLEASAIEEQAQQIEHKSKDAMHASDAFTGANRDPEDKSTAAEVLKASAIEEQTQCNRDLENLSHQTNLLQQRSWRPQPSRSKFSRLHTKARMQ